MTLDKVKDMMVLLPHKLVVLAMRHVMTLVTKVHGDVHAQLPAGETMVATVVLCPSVPVGNVKTIPSLARILCRSCNDTE